MRVRSFFGKIRCKIIRFFLGRELTEKLYGNRSGVAIEGSLRGIQEAMLKTTTRAALATIDIPLVEHCNLNCAGCDHGSPVADESFLELDVFEKDMRRLAELSEGMLGIIRLLGGEPLLHPELFSFIKTTRMFFKNSIIELVTNAVLLEKQSDAFWMSCRENKVSIKATRYPVNIQWGKIERRAKEEGVSFSFFNHYETVKTSYDIPFDLTGIQDTADSFMRCFHANNCRELLNGRIYTCSVAPHAKHFNDYFNGHMVFSDKDSIDIYKAKDMQEILDFLVKPIPFCRYCDIKRRAFGKKWTVSKKAITEWT
jgi:MoaA/NifB/PqqE/SkfB family radical SAM enzyme